MVRFVRRVCTGNKVPRLLACAVALLPLTTAQVCYAAQQPWPLWEKYVSKFLDGSGRVIDRSAQDRTTSEGQAYALFFALVANDRKHFDQILHWTEDNLAAGDLTAHLPAWKWGKAPSGEWKPLDSNAAADADLWLAYDCLEAGRLWRDSRLVKLGSTLATQVAHQETVEIPAVGTVLLPGPKGFQASDSSYYVNLSYVPPQLVARMRRQAPTGPWQHMQRSWPALLKGGAPNGFATDWTRVGSTVGPSAPPSESGQKSSADATGSYDAIRVYLWLGMADKATVGVQNGLRQLKGMADYLENHPLPPLVVASSGKVLDASGTVGFSAAVYPYLLASGKSAQARTQMDRLDASLVPANGLYGRNGDYYDQNLALFAKGWSEHRFRFDGDGRLRVRWR